MLKQMILASAVAGLLAGIFGASPYLTSLIERHPASLTDALARSPEDRFAALTRALADSVAAADAAADAMRALRVYKNDIALLTALCDLAGVWPVMTITRRLSEAADAAVTAAVGFLFRQAVKAGDWLSGEPAGYVVLGIGAVAALALSRWCDLAAVEARRSPVGASATAASAP